MRFVDRLSRAIRNLVATPSRSPEITTDAAPTSIEPDEPAVAPAARIAPEPAGMPIEEIRPKPVAAAEPEREPEPANDQAMTVADDAAVAETVARPGISLTLRLESDRVPVTVFEVTKAGATVGRAPENTIRLEDLSVSRKHARIAYRQGAFWLSDTGSMGGTWVDGARLASARRLATGQVIDMGVCRLTVVTVTSGEGSAEGASRRVIAAHPVDPASRRRAR